VSQSTRTAAAAAAVDLYQSVDHNSLPHAPRRAVTDSHTDTERQISSVPAVTALASRPRCLPQRHACYSLGAPLSISRVESSRVCGTVCSRRRTRCTVTTRHSQLQPALSSAAIDEWVLSWRWNEDSASSGDRRAVATVVGSRSWGRTQACCRLVADLLMSVIPAARSDVADSFAGRSATC